MAHLVETIVYRGEKPWHGIGEKVEEFTSVDDGIKRAGIDWTVSKCSIAPVLSSTEDGVIQYGDFAPKHYALVRSDTKAILDVVGKDYEPSQNRDVLEFLQEFVNAGHAKLETIGSLDGGRYVWGLIKLDQSFTLPGNDRVDPYLLAAVPHKYAYSIEFRYTDVRVVCNNTYTAALRKSAGKFNFRHTSVFDKSTYDAAKQALGLAREQVEESRKRAELLTQIVVPPQKAREILTELFDPRFSKDAEIAQKVVREEVNANRTVERIMLALDYAPGCDMNSAQNTAWGVFNAATFVASHHGSNTDKKVSSLFFGEAARKCNILADKLLELAPVEAR